MQVIVGILLAAAVVVEVACALGVLLTRTPLNRLHFLGPATIVGPLIVAAAVWVEHGVDQSSFKATLVLVLLVASGPILSYVTAHAVIEQGQRQ